MRICLGAIQPTPIHVVCRETALLRLALCRELVTDKLALNIIREHDHPAYIPRSKLSGYVEHKHRPF